MESYTVSLSQHDIELLLVCLSSCAGSCFSNGDKSLAIEYLQLHDRLLKEYLKDIFV